VIPTSGVVPNLGNTWTFSVIPSAGGQPEVVRVWIQSAAHFSSRISPRRGSRHSPLPTQWPQSAN
jgi:hypothetical protein